MAYADQKMSGSRVVAIVIVALIHAVLGYAFVTGLAYKYIKKATEDLDTFEVKEPPPPEEVPPPPPPPPDQPMQPPPVVTPPSIVRTNITPPVVVQSVQTPPAVYTPAPVAVPPAPPPPPRVSQKAGLKGNPGQFFGQSAYPASAIRDEAEGRVRANLTVGTDGRVSGCTVTLSSGNAALDETTCRVSRNRVRFTPAKDEEGNPIVSTYPLAVTWKLER